MPATTTQILFNSPALHSLKRDQLVKLCKIHSIKASGKNVELIQKLKKHAETLPKDDPLSIAVRAEFNQDAKEKNQDANGKDEAVDANSKQDVTEASSSSTPEGSQPSRPPLKSTLSDWEVVMYSIEEEDESQGTVGSTKSGHRGAAGEFGTSSSKSTVGSSIKALANSIGKLKKGSPKRRGSVRHSTYDDSDELEKHSLRYDSLPPSVPPRTDDPLDFDPARMSTDGFIAGGDSPLPGHALRPGVPAPENGRLSLGLSGAPATPSLPTTTIRLIGDRKTPEPADPNKKPVAATPQLKPFETNFDLIMGSPGGSEGSGVPASSIYPTLTFNDLPPSLTSMAKAAPALQSSSTTPLPGGARELPVPQAEKVVPGALSTDDPFVFGSPLPKHRVSDAQFKSAAASVLEEMNKRLQVDGVEGVDTGLIGRLHAGGHKKASLPPKQVNPVPKGEMKEKFDQVHKQEFQKMEGIDAFVKRKEAVKEGMTAPAIIGKKRKSSVVPREGPRRPPGTLISGTRAISNGRRAMPMPGAFGTDNVDEDETQDGEHPEERAGKRIRVASDVVESKEGVDAGTKQTEEEEQAAKEKERQVIKRKLEMNRARRRSSNGPGLNGKRVTRPSMSTKSPQKPKSGFLSSAKSLVANVLGRGKTDAATSDAIPRPIAQSKPTTSLLRKALTPAKSAATEAVRTTGIKVNAESNLSKPTAASAARLRSPIPTFGLGSARAAPTSNSLTPSAATARKASGTATSGLRVTSSQVTSMGTRPSAPPSNAGVGSLGTKRLPSGTPSKASRVASNPSSTSRLPVTSRLLAPTASSLAKMGKTSGPAPKERLTPAQALKSPPGARRNTAALDVITNSPAVAGARTTISPTKGKIFSQPLQLVAPTPAKKEGTASVLSPGNDDLKSASVRQLSMNGKRPRVSRSKVIAKLASQRAAGTSAIPTTPAHRASVAATPRRGSAFTPKAGAKPRSSLGAKVVRNSIAGAKVADGPSSGVLLSAKKRVRQSEYYRRRSVAPGSSPLKPQGRQSGGGDAMDVDQ